MEMSAREQVTSTGNDTVGTTVSSRQIVCEAVILTASGCPSYEI